ncbi:MAG: 50S ribosomal protein L13 [Candidatus Aureabacteria bacterium]|nr:50S ribosomal protein L13 [Candidatus Auribacterota bacterium]
MKTYSAKASEIRQKWYLIDAEGQILGRLATRIADIMRGKNKPLYTPHLDTGDFVVVINAEKVAVTGRKAEKKEYQRYTGFAGGLKRTLFPQMLATHPERIIEHAVRGMIPHHRLGKKVMTKLKVYAGSKHPHSAQQPEPIKL